MSIISKVSTLLLASGFLLVTGFAVAQVADGLESTVNTIRSDAAKVDAASGTEKAEAKKILLKAVSSAIAKAKNADEVARIITAAVTAAPTEAAEITAAAVTAAPASAAAITTAAVTAAPASAAAITTAAVTAAPASAAAITTAAVTAAPASVAAITSAAVAAAPSQAVAIISAAASVTGANPTPHIGGGTASPS